MKIKLLIISIICAAIILPVFVLAAPPQLPHILYGNVTNNGNNVPVNTVIIAKVGGVEKGRITVSTAGQYGGSGALDEKLLVQGNISNGAVISFYIGDNSASQTVNFSSGSIQQLNLTFTTTTTTTSPGGSGITPITPATAKKGDVNNDGKVDIIDFNLLMVNWGNNPTNLAADLNGDGKVDIFDFNILMVNWTI
ncbi:hypothetical protein KKE19_00385 [Patescibacteria group bacterium]|nr:hypothetical protein [Patescibacteria group bacterium]MBU4274260.1 hypothetical protein [Patescibacteria group bacterium]MBU4367637.1 hypothetical protein [Patescibacteria group bacterium]MBU4462117.1 hypothetical protein [Patescibacteria group bacterium]MCG2700436.1 dockerin type I domain-containing protein [Candidatus Parcubacteria bacterium]